MTVSGRGAGNGEFQRRAAIHQQCRAGERHLAGRGRDVERGALYRWMQAARSMRTVRGMWRAPVRAELRPARAPAAPMAAWAEWGKMLHRRLRFMVPQRRLQTLGRAADFAAVAAIPGPGGGTGSPDRQRDPDRQRRYLCQWCELNWIPGRGAAPAARYGLRRRAWRVRASFQPREAPAEKRRAAAEGSPSITTERTIPLPAFPRPPPWEAVAKRNARPARPRRAAPAP